MSDSEKTILLKRICFFAYRYMADSSTAHFSINALNYCIKDWIKSNSDFDFFSTDDKHEVVYD